MSRLDLHLLQLLSGNNSIGFWLREPERWFAWLCEAWMYWKSRKVDRYYLIKAKLLARLALKATDEPGEVPGETGSVGITV